MLKYHVYAEDGFESAHRSLAAAQRAAMRGARRRGLEYRVIVCSSGYTGGGHGTIITTIDAKGRATGIQTPVTIALRRAR